MGFPHHLKVECSYEKFCKQKWHKTKKMATFQKKFELCHFAFMKDLTLVPVFTNGKKPEEDFHFCGKSQYCSNVGLS